MIHESRRLTSVEINQVKKLKKIFIDQLTHSGIRFGAINIFSCELNKLIKEFEEYQLGD